MKDRLLNILLVSFVVLLGMNLFLPKPQKAVEVTDPHFEVSQSSVVVPNYPKVTLKNPSENTITFNTCKELTILQDLRTVTIDGPATAFCRDITVAPKSSQDINISELTQLFTRPGSVGFKIISNGKEITTNITVEERGSIRVLMASLFYAPILNLFVGILQYLPSHSLGLAIIIITILVRLILLVPQHQMMVSARKMQEIQPKIKALQQKHKGDQSKIGMELMALYKAEKVNPLGSCLPLLIQTPILIVLYWVLISIQDHSNYFYLYSFFKEFEISKIQHVFLGMDLLSIGGITAVALGLVVGMTQFLQIWLSQKRTGPVVPVTAEERDPNSLLPDPQMMNKFMLWVLPVVIAVSVYYFPLGVGMYWFIGTLFMLIQQAIANRVTENQKKKGVVLSGNSESTAKKSKKNIIIEG